MQLNNRIGRDLSECATFKPELREEVTPEQEPGFVLNAWYPVSIVTKL
jgi:hypothetical protein